MKPVHLTALELERARRIAILKAEQQRLGLLDGIADFAVAVHQKRTETARPKPQRKPKDIAPPRRSTRLQKVVSPVNFTTLFVT